jgi:hypothetical protein
VRANDETIELLAAEYECGEATIWRALNPFEASESLSDYQRKEALRRRAAGETLAEIAKSYAVDTSMISCLKA